MSLSNWTWIFTYRYVLWNDYKLCVESWIWKFSCSLEHNTWMISGRSCKFTSRIYRNVLETNSKSLWLYRRRPFDCKLKCTVCELSTGEYCWELENHWWLYYAYKYAYMNDMKGTTIAYCEMWSELIGKLGEIFTWLMEMIIVTVDIYIEWLK